MKEYPDDLQNAVDLLYRISPQSAQVIHNYLAVSPNGKFVDDLRLAASTIRNHAHTGVRTKSKRHQLELADRLSLYACELLE
jgi:hypothetical protein